MHNVLITYPRSGQQLIAHSLIQYFDLDFDKNYCEYYTCCQRFPCAKKDVLLHKNHDMSMEFPISESVRYLVGIRHPYDSLLSYCKLYGKHQTPEEFMTCNARYWNRFVEKWVLTDLESRAIFEYKNIIANYVSELDRAIRFIRPDVEPDLDKIKLLQINVTTGAGRRGIKKRSNRKDYACHSNKLHHMVMDIVNENMYKIERMLKLRL